METNNKMMINKIVIGVSGGPDSIYLLNDLYNNPRFTPIVVHVNYHFRDEANDEQQFVENYCKERSIDIHILDVTKDDLSKYIYLGNKQSIARQLRYDKYISVANEYNTKHIFIAQHKDDFIETAIMQENKSKDDYLFYGIQSLTHYNGLMIHRPLLKMWKQDIIKYLDDNNIEYKIDKSNFEPIYERNKIRLELLNKSIEEKEEIFNRFNLINESKKELRDNIDKYYEELLNSEYDYDTFNNIPSEYKRHVIYKWLINNNVTRINISSDKLDGIVEFLSHKRGDKSYRLMEKVFLSVKNSKIIIYTKN